MVWRLAHPKNPCDFVPHQYCNWNNRFDDPLKQYRTLYGAELAVTCLRELLADIRPNPKAIDELEALFDASPGGPTVAGVVSSEWRRQHVLVEARPLLSAGALVDIEAPEERNRLAKAHARLLKTYGVLHLDLSTLRSRQRPLTRAFFRTLYDEGSAGIRFHSRLDGNDCFAFFEGRAVLRQIGKAISMNENHPDLLKVCGEYTLVLRPAAGG